MARRAALAALASVLVFATVVSLAAAVAIEDPNTPPVKGNILVVGMDGRALACAGWKDTCFFYGLNGMPVWSRLPVNEFPATPADTRLHIVGVPFMGFGAAKLYYSVTVDGIYYSRDDRATWTLLAPWELPPNNQTTTGAAQPTMPAQPSDSGAAPAPTSNGGGMPAPSSNGGGMPAPSSNVAAPSSNGGNGMASSSGGAPAPSATGGAGGNNGGNNGGTTCTVGPALVEGTGLGLKGEYWYQIGEEPTIVKDVISTIEFDSIAILACGPAFGNAHTGSGSTVAFNGTWDGKHNRWFGTTVATTPSNTKIPGFFTVTLASKVTTEAVIKYRVEGTMAQDSALTSFLTYFEVHTDDGVILAG